MGLRIILLILGLFFFQAAGLTQDNFIFDTSPEKDIPEAVLVPGMVSRERSADTAIEAGEDANYLEEWSSINKKQPIGEGEKIYSITSMEKKSVEVEKGRYRSERTWKTKKYVYDEYLYGSIRVVYTSTDQYDVEQEETWSWSGTASMLGFIIRF